MNEQQLEIAKKMNDCVTTVLGSNVSEGFVRANKVAIAVATLYELLTPEYMAPIMKLQGTRLGFKTDRDSEGGYGMDVVRKCLIEAVLMGVQPTGNQFNIISGDAYITKEGYGHILSNTSGLSYKITPQLPRISGDKTSAAVKVNIRYTYNGKTATEELDIPAKVHPKSASPDYVIGKAIRKARAWIHTTITGSETPEGDIMDTDAQVIKTTINEQPVTLDEVRTMFTEKGHLLGEPDKAAALRILDTQEVNSYAKLKEKLTSL